MIYHDTLSLNMGKIHSYAQWPEGKIWTRIVQECPRSVHEIWLHCEAKIGLGDGNGSWHELWWWVPMAANSCWLIQCNIQRFISGMFFMNKVWLVKWKSGYEWIWYICKNEAMFTTKVCPAPPAFQSPDIVRGGGASVLQSVQKESGFGHWTLEEIMISKTFELSLLVPTHCFRSEMEQFYSLHTSVSVV